MKMLLKTIRKAIARQTAGKSPRDKLVAATLRGDAAEVGRLLEDPAIAPHVSRAVFAAAGTGAVDVIKVAAAKRGPSVLHDREHLALCMAARRGDLEMLKTLIASGSLLTARGGQAIRLARLHAHADILQLIEDMGLGSGKPATLATLLQCARQNDHVRLDQLLHVPDLAPHVTRAVFAAIGAGAAGVVESAAKRFGPSVLHDRNHLALRIAARRGDRAMIGYLLASGDMPEASTGRAARIAALHGHYEIAELCGGRLLEARDIDHALDKAATSIGGPIVFLDIAGTAGETVSNRLVRLFSGKDRLGLSRSPQQVTPAGCFARDVVAAQVRKLSSAEQSGPLGIIGRYSCRMREILPPSRLFMTMVADPVARLARAYHTEIVRAHPELAGVSLEAFLQSEEALTRFGYRTCDHQVRVLSGDTILDPDGYDPATRPVPVRADDTDRTIKELSERFLLIGVSDRLDDSLVALARQLGLPLTVLAGFPASARAASDIPAVTDRGRELIMALNMQDARLVAAANAMLDQVIAADAIGFARDRQLFDRLQVRSASGESFYGLLDWERVNRPTEAPKLYYAPPAPVLGDHERGRAAYLDLLEDILVNRIYMDPSMAPWSGNKYLAQDRDIGSDWPSRAHSMVGKRRIRNVRRSCEMALAEAIPGDFLEAGVWRGGSTIMMRAVLKMAADTQRTVWVADSFSGVPPPDEENYPADGGDKHFEAKALAIPQSEVAENFRRYGLLDRQVRFLPGLFKDTLAGAPIERLSVLRLDGDLYESTMDTLVALYDRVSPGGFIIVDDYGAVPGCKTAIEEFRAMRSITAPLVEIDWAGVYWRKP